jgi:hypothetical protein
MSQARRRINRKRGQPRPEEGIHFVRDESAQRRSPPPPLEREEPPRFLSDDFQRHARLFVLNKADPKGLYVIPLGDGTDTFRESIERYRRAHPEIPMPTVIDTTTCVITIGILERGTLEPGERFEEVCDLHPIGRHENLI